MVVSNYNRRLCCEQWRGWRRSGAYCGDERIVGAADHMGGGKVGTALHWKVIQDESGRKVGSSDVNQCG